MKKKMKKIIAVIALALFLPLMILPISAYAVDEAPAEEEEVVEELPKEEAPVEEVPEEAEDEKIAELVYIKIKDSLPEGFVENLDEIIANWKATDKEDATFGDRVQEFFAPDNLPATIAMLFMVVVGIIIYVMKRSQAASIESTNSDLIMLKNEIKDQHDNVMNVGAGVNGLLDDIDKLTDCLNRLSESIENKQDSAEAARLAAVGVATMLKNIFQNSRTIDDAGKKIMNLDYLKAIGEGIEEALEEDKKEDKVEHLKNDEVKVEA